MVAKEALSFPSFTKYTFKDYDTFLSDLKAGKIPYKAFEYFLSNLHTFDHNHEEILMYSYARDKRYWHKHKQIRFGYKGTFKDGHWVNKGGK
jgi:hypothetical protein